MAYWQFLIQKDGDRSWLPLSPQAELLEGRYRVVARSSYRNTKVDIHLSYLSVEQGVPKRKRQQRSHMTNDDGLLVVMPFTQLQPGLWELACVGRSVGPASQWQELIQLEVLPQDLEAISDWDWIDPKLRSLVEPDAFGTEQTAKSTSSEPVNSTAQVRQQQVKITPLRLPTFKKQGQLLQLKVSSGQIIPPQLSHPDAPQNRQRPPELPVIPRSPAQRAAQVRIQAAPADTVQLTSASAAAQVSLTNIDFEAPNLKSRFWTTLNGLVKGTESIKPYEQGYSGSQLPNNSSQSDSLHQPGSVEKLEQRFSSNIDATRSEEQGLVNLGGLLIHPENQWRLQAALSKRFCDHEIVPTPSLVVPEGTLMVGKPITVYVRLPQQQPPIYVKLWVNDCQTHSLLDGPRWIVDFASQQAGCLEAFTQLTIPADSREISFEAIAIDVQTQRESHKVTVERSVINGQS